MRFSIIALVAFVAAQTASAFAPLPSSPDLARRPTGRRSTIVMGKMAKFGLFSPAVLGARKVLGEKRLNKLRGQGITLHSQAITEFCVYVGASSKLRGGLIKKAKTNGDELGFLY